MILRRPGTSSLSQPSETRTVLLSVISSSLHTQSSRGLTLSTFDGICGTISVVLIEDHHSYYISNEKWSTPHVRYQLLSQEPRSPPSEQGNDQYHCYNFSNTIREHLRHIRAVVIYTFAKPDNSPHTLGENSFLQHYRYHLAQSHH